MAKYLLTIVCTGTPPDVGPAPADYLVDVAEEAGAAPAADGLERWTVELQIAGTVADWAAGPAFAALWDVLERAVAGLEVKPRAALTIRARVDGKRIGVALPYMGRAEIGRARVGLEKKLAGAIDPKTKRLKADVELAVNA